MQGVRMDPEIDSPSATVIEDGESTASEPQALEADTKTETASITSTDATSATGEYVIVQTGGGRSNKKTVANDDDEPLIDTTAAIAKNSKKTRRLLKQQEKRQKKYAAKARPQSPFDLPPEILQEVLSYLKPSDVLRLELLSHAINDFILDNEWPIAKDIMDRRYWVLRQCFPLPTHLSQVDEESQTALRNPRREKMTEIHKKPYQHIRAVDSTVICSCPSCLLAWNNLNVILDFWHSQQNLNMREPIPMIPRGMFPKWNLELIEKHARIVDRAMFSPLTYATIVEKHLESTIGTLLRQVRFPPHLPMHRHNKAAMPKTVHPVRLYHVTEKDADGTDEFLERDGKPSYEFPFSRDNYYSLLAYVPNRKWDKEKYEWVYFAKGGHERDLEWARRWFLPQEVPSSSQEALAASFQAATVA
ncbi:hypothetical protein LTR78_002858 [Recurvomyces mirabilis]|uniref:F-box domain-containing protein n=1 Tax=Recurvomyces mirabilis TaxID=574656 RepID=A0AAE1C477_9PEZI|nr:hypothetical protein LTR78_002858 [Recurvomyces mirabilis]